MQLKKEEKFQNYGRSLGLTTEEESSSGVDDLLRVVGTENSGSR
jgi:hypothetical protein